MTTSTRPSDEQIERAAKDNPDLPKAFIRDALLAAEEIKAGQTKRYIRRNDQPEAP